MAGRVEGHSLLDSLRCNFFLFFFFFVAPLLTFAVQNPQICYPDFFFASQNVRFTTQKDIFFIL